MAAISAAKAPIASGVAAAARFVLSVGTPPAPVLVPLGSLVPLGLSAVLVLPDLVLEGCLEVTVELLPPVGAEPLPVVVSDPPVPVAVALTLVPDPVGVAVAFRPAEYSTHSSAPTDWAASRSLAAVQALMRHGAARAAIAVWVGPQAQPWSFASQPAAVTAEAMQEV